jgi:hypothetical protein
MTSFSISFDHMLYVICRLSYAKSHMLVFICWMPCASYCKFTIISGYMPISVSVSACSMLNLACQLQYTNIYVPAHECLIFPISCQVSLYVNLSGYMSNCYISVYMPSALFHMLYVECYGLYAKLHMLDCNMSNVMTIAMSFSMTTEQVEHFIIYIYIYIYLLPGYDSPYCRYREEITIISPWFQFISQVSGILVCKHIRLLSNILSHMYFSMPTYHGMSKILVCRHIMASTKIPNHHLFRFANISRHQSITHIAVYFGMPAYHGIL